jgi:RimJ/RimL family protein N-acetyltransferase
MARTILRTSLGNFPRVFSAKNGQLLRIQLLRERHYQSFVEAYLAYRPRNAFQGLPPLKDKVCEKWAWQMIDAGINLIAVSSQGGIAGHAALFPIDDCQCEMLVVVWPQFQNVGLGAELTRGCVEMGCALGFGEMWVAVDAANLRARHVYAKCGFAYRSPEQVRELDMICDLSRLRAKRETEEVAAEASGIPASHFGLNFSPMPLGEQAMT